MRHGTLRLRLDELESRTVLSSPGDIDWLRQIGSTQQAIGIGRAVDADGNVYLAGDAAGPLPGATNVGGSDPFVRKYDANGIELWTREFGGSAADPPLVVAETITAVAVHGSAVYVAGYTLGTLPGQVNAGIFDAFVRKYDTDGNELWTRQFGTVASEEADAVAADDTGVYVGGTTVGVFPGQTSSGFSDAFVRKYDVDGTELWTHQFGNNDTSPEAVTGIAVDGSGVYVAATLGRPGQSGEFTDALLRRYDTNGNEVWSQLVTSTRARGLAAGNSGIYIIGSLAGALPGQTSAGGQDAFLRKYDASGGVVWTHQFGTAASDTPTDVAVGASGVYVSGITEGTLPGQTSAGGQDAFIRRYNVDGNESWTRQFGTRIPQSIDFTDDARGIAVDATGVYLVGTAAGPLVGSSTGGGAYVRKYDTTGSELWTRQLNGANSRDDFVRAVDADGNIYVAGQIAGSISSDQTIVGDIDAFVRKYDAAGNELWTRQFGTVFAETVNSITVDGSGVYLAGLTFGTFRGETSAGGQDAFVRKYDVNGNELWTHQFGSTGINAPADSATGVAVDASGVYVVGVVGLDAVLPGQTSSGDRDAFIRKYDFAGSELWTRQFGGAKRSGGLIIPSPSDTATGVAVDGTDIYVSGSTLGTFAGQTSPGNQDAFVRKYDAAGNVIWTRQFGTAGTDQATGIAADASGLYVSGFTSGTFAGQTSAGGQDAFMRRMDTAGNELWTRQFGTLGADQANGVAASASGIYVAGFVTGALPGKTSAGGQDAFVRKYDTSGAIVWTGQFGTSAGDSATGVTVGPSGVFVAGSTAGTFPGQLTVAGQDGFLAKIVDDVVSNTPPSNVSLNLPAAINEGGTATLTGSFTDPNAGDTHTVAINWGPSEGTTTLNLAAGVTTFSATHTYLDDNPTATAFDVYTVAAVVNDAAGGSASASTNVTVNNLAPAAAIASPTPSGVYIVGTPVSLTGSFTDAGIADMHTAQWVLDGHTFAGSLTESGGSGTVADSYTFSAAGVYLVRLTVTDDDGGTGSDLVSITVIGRPTTTAVSASMTAPLFGVDGENLTAAVSAVQSGVGTPTGTVTFYDGNSTLGTISLVNGSASLALGSTALSVGSHAIRAVYSGDSGFAGSESTVVINVLAPSAVQGIVYVDFNNDGQIDFGERAIADVAITLAGNDDLGNSVSRTVHTDANGIYALANLRPSDAGGYAISETQPVDLLDGRETVGTVNGAALGSVTVNDTFSGVVLAQGGSLAENYNFGERPTTAGGVAPGQTATIGFWQNRNGQNLLTALNGGASATQLGQWLAHSFPNMYAGLDGMTNAQVAAYYKTLFARTSIDSPGGPPKVDAQVMATAFAVYVTNQTLAGTSATAYGFQVTTDGVGARTLNVGSNGNAFGVTNNSVISVMDLLLAVNTCSHNGLLYDLNDDGQISSSEAALRTMANVVFSGINEAGDI